MARMAASTGDVGGCTSSAAKATTIASNVMMDFGTMTVFAFATDRI